MYVNNSTYLMSLAKTWLPGVESGIREWQLQPRNVSMSVYCCILFRLILLLLLLDLLAILADPGFTNGGKHEAPRQVG